jgi:hypothetical protein
METEKQTENKIILKDALGRKISRSYDSTYYIYVDKPVQNVSSFFDFVEKEIKNKGFVKLFMNSPNSKKNVAKAKIKKKSKIACTAIPSHFAILNKVLTSEPNDELVNHEWKTIYYCGFSGLHNPSEDFIRIFDVNSLSFAGSEFKI